MAATFIVTCPECEKAAKASEDLVGKKIRCKSCDHVYVVKAPGGNSSPAKAAATKPAPGKSAPTKRAPAKPAPAKAVTGKASPEEAKKPAKGPAKVEDDTDVKPYVMTQVYLGPRCPECANEMESEEAIVCIHCGYNTRTRVRAVTKKTFDVSGRDRFMWLLPGIVCAVGVIVLFTIDLVFTLNIDDWTKETWAEGLWGPVKLWLWIISLFVFFGLGRFAIIRLLFKNRPPEIEKKEVSRHA